MKHSVNSVFIISALVVSCLTGCANRPVRSDAALHTPLGDTFSNATSQGTPFKDAWWEIFNDPALDSLIHKALADNYDIRIAIERIRMARAAAEQVATRNKPTLSFAGLVANQNSTLPEVVKRQQPNTQAFQVGLGIGWEIDVFGSAKYAQESAMFDAQAVEQAANAARLLTASEVARMYFEHRAAQLRLLVLQKMLNLQQEIAALSLRQQQEGLISQYDLAAIDAETNTFAAQLSSIKDIIHFSAHQMAILLGSNPSIIPSELNLTSDYQLPVLPEIPAGQPADLLKRRPDVRAAQMQWLAESARLQQTNADRYPQFFLSALFGQEKLILNATSVPAAVFSNVALAFSAPILNWGRLEAAVEQQEAKQSIASLTYEQSVLRAVSDVENSLSALREERERFTHLANAAKQRDQQVKYAQMLAREGQISQLDLKGIERIDLDAHLALIGSNLNLDYYAVQLFKSLGGGWSTPSE